MPLVTPSDAASGATPELGGAATSYARGTLEVLRPPREGAQSAQDLRLHCEELAAVAAAAAAEAAAV